MIGYIEDEYNVLKEFKYKDGDKQHIYQLRQKNDLGFDNIFSRFYKDMEKFKKEKPERYKEALKSHKSSLIPYVSIEIYNEAKTSWVDLLLFYSDNLEEGTIDKDWKTISTDKTVKISELSFDYRIEDHHTGYGKDGMIVMY